MQVDNTSWSSAGCVLVPKALDFSKTLAIKNTFIRLRMNLVELPSLCCSASTSCLRVKTPYPSTSLNLGGCRDKHHTGMPTELDKCQLEGGAALLSQVVDASMKNLNIGLCGFF